MRQWLVFTKAEIVVLAVSVVALLGCGGVWLTRTSAPPGPVTFHEAPPPLRVQVTGAVSRPGIYSVRPGARVYEVIELAGGATADASTDNMNLAAPVQADDKIVVPAGRPK